MRLLAVFASLLGCIVATCSQEPCYMEEDSKGVLPPSDQLMMNNNMELPFGKRFSPEQIRKASIRWGKRAMTKSVSPQMLRGSSRFWGKRDVADSIRRSSIRWGKRSQYDISHLPTAVDLYPSPLFGQNVYAPFEEVVTDSDESVQEPIGTTTTDAMHRVAKAELLRPKLALSSRLWGRK